MRRPLKPFVTEYKGARRAPSNPPQSFDTFRESEPQPNGAPHRSPSPWPSDIGAAPADRPRPRPVDMSPVAEPEDAYEAAMRAADALFARPASPPAPRSTPSQPRPEAQALQPDQTAPARGGRILPVLDEAPSPQLAALEAAYAPKRRGRKPGSKNKPKPVAASIETSQPAATFFYNEPEAEEASEHGAMAVAEDAPKAVFQAPAIQTLKALSAGNGHRVQRRIGKFDDRVKPGEGWKRRRLPRVCW